MTRRKIVIEINRNEGFDFEGIMKEYWSYFMPSSKTGHSDRCGGYFWYDIDPDTTTVPEARGFDDHANFGNGIRQTNYDAAISKLQGDVFDLRKTVDAADSPGNWRLAKDVKNLRDRVEKLENESYKQQDVDDIDCKVAALSKQMGEFSVLMQNRGNVTVHSRVKESEDRIEKLEEVVKVLSKALDEANAKIKDGREDCHIHVRDLRDQVEREVPDKARLSQILVRIDALETCCKNAVASGKALEGRVDVLASDISTTWRRIEAQSEKLETVTKRVTGFRDNIRQVVKDILTSAL